MCMQRWACYGKMGVWGACARQSAGAKALRPVERALLCNAAINGTVAVRMLDRMYLSFNIDANIFPALNFSRPQLAALASELQPAMVRLGGGAADLQAYLHPLPHSAGLKMSEWNVMTKEYWQSILLFANSSGLRLLCAVRACACACAPDVSCVLQGGPVG